MTDNPRREAVAKALCQNEYDACGCENPRLYAREQGLSCSAEITHGWLADRILAAADAAAPSFPLPADVKALVERARGWASDLRAERSYSEAACLDDAADALERLARENADNETAARHQAIARREATARAEKAEAALAVAREALAEFGRVGELMSDDDGWSDTDDLHLEMPDGVRFAAMTSGQFRAARAALARIDEITGGGDAATAEVTP